MVIGEENPKKNKKRGKKMSYLAIDIGASSGRHMLGKTVNGKVELKEIYRFKNGPKMKNGHLCWTASSFFRILLPE